MGSGYMFNLIEPVKYRSRYTHRQGVDLSYVKTLADCYASCKTTVFIFHRRVPISFAK